MITNYHNFSEVYKTTVIAGNTGGYDKKCLPKTDQCSALKNFRNKFRLDLYRSFMNKNEQLRTGGRSS